jgi:hypothetical protein
MDAKPPFDPLDDLALDREIQAALSVEPSPEFLARVWMRVADDRRARPLLTIGALGGLAVALTVIVAALVLAPQEERPNTPLKTVEARPPSPAGDAARGRVDAPLRAGAPPPREVPGPSVVRNIVQPPVIVPVEQVAAFRRLADAINAGTAFPDEIELPEPDPSAGDEDTQQILANLRRPIEPLAAVRIEPLGIEPISQ